MTKYLLKRLFNGLVSVIIVVGIVMVMIYTLLDRNLVFAQDTNYSHQSNNQKTVYKYAKWEDYGYIDYVTYADYLTELVGKNEITEETRNAVAGFGRTADKDSEEVAKYVAQFKEYYESKGYTVVRLDAIMMGKKKYATGGQQQLFAYKDVPLWNRLGSYLKGFITIDNVNNVENIVGERGVSFTLYDPVYGGINFHQQSLGMEQHISTYYTVIPSFHLSIRI